MGFKKFTRQAEKPVLPGDIPERAEPETFPTMEPAKKIKIAFLNDSSRIGGAERSLAFLIKNLNPAVFESIVICPKGGPLIEELASQNIKVIARDINHFSRKHRVFNYVVSLFKLLYLIKKLRIDIIHCNTIGAAHWGLPIGIYIIEEDCLPYQKQLLYEIQFICCTEDA